MIKNFGLSALLAVMAFTLSVSSFAADDGSTEAGTDSAVAELNEVKPDCNNLEPTDDPFKDRVRKINCIVAEVLVQLFSSSENVADPIFELDEAETSYENASAKIKFGVRFKQTAWDDDWLGEGNGAVIDAENTYIKGSLVEVAPGVADGTVEASVKLQTNTVAFAHYLAHRLYTSEAPSFGGEYSACDENIAVAVSRIRFLSSYDRFYLVLKQLKEALLECAAQESENEEEREEMVRVINKFQIKSAAENEGRVYVGVKDLVLPFFDGELLTIGTNLNVDAQSLTFDANVKFRLEDFEVNDFRDEIVGLIDQFMPLLSDPEARAEFVEGFRDFVTEIEEAVNPNPQEGYLKEELWWAIEAILPALLKDQEFQRTFLDRLYDLVEELRKEREEDTFTVGGVEFLTAEGFDALSQSEQDAYIKDLRERIMSIKR